MSRDKENEISAFLLLKKLINGIHEFNLVKVI